MPRINERGAICFDLFKIWPDLSLSFPFLSLSFPRIAARYVSSNIHETVRSPLKRTIMATMQLDTGFPRLDSPRHGPLGNLNFPTGHTVGTPLRRHRITRDTYYRRRTWNYRSYRAWIMRTLFLEMSFGCSEWVGLALLTHIGDARVRACACACVRDCLPIVFATCLIIDLQGVSCY